MSLFPFGSRKVRMNRKGTFSADPFSRFPSPVFDEHGRRIPRIKAEHRYNYSAFVQERLGFIEDANQTYFSDRLVDEDGPRARTLMAKHFGDDGDIWTNRSAKDIEAFLAEWLGRSDVHVLIVMEACDVSTGTAYWVFHTCVGELRRAPKADGHVTPGTRERLEANCLRDHLQASLGADRVGKVCKHGLHFVAEVRPPLSQAADFAPKWLGLPVRYVSVPPSPRT